MGISPINPNGPTSANQGVGGPTQGNPVYANETKEIIAETKELMANMVKAEETIDIESSLVTTKEVGQGKTGATDGGHTMIAQKEAAKAQVAVQELTALIDEQHDVKKKRKKTKLEEKLEELEQLEGNINDAQMTAEEKGVVSKFFDFMAQIKNLRGRLKQLALEEQQLEELLKEKKKREKEEQEQKRRSQPPFSDDDNSPLVTKGNPH